MDLNFSYHVYMQNLNLNYLENAGKWDWKGHRSWSLLFYLFSLGLPRGSVVKESACNAGDAGDLV